MERKIGEIFEHNCEWYQCVEVGQQCCSDCAFHKLGSICHSMKCSLIIRSDETSVIFKKLEKVGEPFSCNYFGDSRLVMMQEYQLFDENMIYCNKTLPMYITVHKHKRIAIELKRNKEDMGDNDDIRPYDELFSPGTVSNTKYLAKEDMEENKLNLKPFDIQKAREGKPVCTRDGRKARIICFDKADERPIVALISDNGSEFVYEYLINGKCYESRDDSNDLMMLPEKKEGWVNVYREESNNNERLIEQTIYKTRKDAFEHACPQGYITTTKINWEE